MLEVVILLWMLQQLGVINNAVSYCNSNHSSCFGSSAIRTSTVDKREQKEGGHSIFSVVIGRFNSCHYAGVPVPSNMEVIVEVFGYISDRINR